MKQIVLFLAFLCCLNLIYGENFDLISDSIIESTGGILFDHCKISNDNLELNIVNELNTNSYFNDFEKADPLSMKNGGDQYTLEYANMCFRSTLDYCDKSDYTYAYITHKNFFGGKICARLTGSTPPEITLVNYNEGVVLTYPQGDQCFTNSVNKFQVVVEVECYESVQDPVLTYNITSCVFNILLQTPSGCAKKIEKPLPPVPLFGDCIYNISKNEVYYLYGLYGTRDFEFKTNDISIYHNICEFTGHRCGSSQKIYALRQNNTDKNCWTLTGASAQVNQIQDGLVKIDYGLGEKCLTDPNNHYSASAYIYCDKSVNTTVSSFNITKCHYNFNYYSPYGCVNMIPDIPAPKEWSKASIKNCVVTVANQNYYLEGIFDRKGIVADIGEGQFEIGICQYVPNECHGIKSYAVFRQGDVCYRFTGEYYNIFSSNTMIRIDYSMGQKCDEDDNFLVTLYVICDPDQKLARFENAGTFGCNMEFRVYSQNACASTTPPVITTTTTSFSPKAFSFSLSAFLLSVKSKLS